MPAPLSEDSAFVRAKSPPPGWREYREARKMKAVSIYMIEAAFAYKKNCYLCFYQYQKAKIMSSGCQIKEQNELHYLTFQVVEWVDIFTRKVYRDIVVDSLRYCQEKKGLEIYAFVVMSNHIHLLAKSEIRDLSDVVREFKSFTAREILKAVESEPESRRDWMLNIFEFAAKRHKRCEKYQFWTHENHPEIIYSNKFVDQKINYIHENPVRADIVEYVGDYLYSSARAYAGKTCLLDIIPVIRSVEKTGLMRTIR